MACPARLERGSRRPARAPDDRRRPSPASQARRVGDRSPRRAAAALSRLRGGARRGRTARRPCRTARAGPVRPGVRPSRPRRRPPRRGRAGSRDRRLPRHAGRSGGGGPGVLFGLRIRSRARSCRADGGFSSSGGPACIPTTGAARRCCISGPGLAAYVAEHGIEILFGVASFPGTDTGPLAQPLSFLHHHHLAPPPLRVHARATGGRRWTCCRPTGSTGRPR
jgi:hypothetical protein